MQHFQRILFIQKNEILQNENLSEKLLRKNEKSLTADQKDMLMAFALGYLTHAAVDMALHPLVYYFSGNYYDPVEIITSAESRFPIVDETGSPVSTLPLAFISI